MFQVVLMFSELFSNDQVLEAFARKNGWTSSLRDGKPELTREGPNQGEMLALMTEALIRCSVRPTRARVAQILMDTKETPDGQV